MSGPTAAWLRALAALAPKDDEARAAIARVLGVRWSPTDGAEPLDPDARAEGGRAEGARESAAETETAGAERTPEEAARDAPTAGRRIASVMARVDVSADAAPAWLATARHIEAPQPRHRRPRLALDPLLDPRTTRAIVGGALATPSVAGALDVAAVIDRICRARPIDAIPSRPVPTLVRGAQLLVDQADGMQPFAADQAALGTAVARVVGRDRTTRLFFAGSPLWGAGAGARDEWRPYEPPPPGTPVLALTDLGVGRPADALGVAAPADWERFCDALDHAGCPLLALVPYPPHRWPPSLRRRMTIVQWDRATTAAAVRRAVGDGLRTHAAARAAGR